MMTTSSKTASNEIRSELEKNKKNYINVITFSKRLSDRYSGSHALGNVFNAETCRLRDKFKQMCETLLFDDPVDYGLKIIDLLWRKAAYEPIQLFKREQHEYDERTALEIEILYRMHLAGMFSFYSNLLVKFAVMLKPHRNLSEFFDFVQFSSENKSVHHHKSENLIESLLKLLHKCLVCLGDLSRYSSDYDACTETAEKYYTMAVLLDPEIGMPLNQLGTLAGRSNCSCDAAFFYLLCLNSAHPFDGAKENLQMLFHRNKKRLIDLNKQKSKHQNEESSNREIRHFLVEFLDVTHELLESNNIGQIQDLGQKTLNDFNACMFYQNESQLSDDLIFELISISMFVVDRIQRTRSRTVKQPILFAGIAFAIALFSHIVNHTLIRLQNAFYQLHGARTGATESQSDAEDEQQQEEAKEKRRKRMKMLMSRRRRRRSASLSDQSVQSENSLSDDDNSSDQRKEDSSDEEGSEDEIPDYLSGDSSDDGEDQENSMQPSKTGTRDEKEREAEELAIKIALEEFMEKIKQSGPLFHNSNDPQSNQSTLFSFTDLSAHLFAAFASNDYQSPLFVDYNGPDDDPYSMSLHSPDHAYKSIPIGNREFNVPPGFEHDSDALAAAEIEQKMAQFELEPIIDNLTNDQRENPDTEEKVRRQSAKLIIDLIENEKLLASIKVFCDWLAGNRRLLEMLLPISPGLWSKLALLLNFLPHEQDILKSGLITLDSSIYPLLSKFVDTRMFTALPPMLDEDIRLRPFVSLKVNRNHGNLNLNKLSALNSTESTVVRLCSLRRFGYYIASILSSGLFTYDSEKLIFSAQIPAETQINTVPESSTIESEPIVVEERKTRLMREMAALRLQAEISQLENSLKNEDFALPPYLVVDPSVLCTNLKLIQNFVHSQRFIVVIPLAVIDALDELKKEQHEARDAIRWLENQFRQGNRFIRTQAVHERVNNPNNANKKKNPKAKDFLRFQEIIDCCLYFTQQTGVEKLPNTTAASSMSTVNLLMARSLTSKEQQVVEKDGVIVQHIDEFYRSWQKSAH